MYSVYFLIFYYQLLILIYFFYIFLTGQADIKMHAKTGKKNKKQIQQQQIKLPVSKT